MSTPAPPYTRSFLIQYRQQYVDQLAAKALSDFVNATTHAVLSAAKEGLISYTVKTIPVTTQFQQAMNALKVNFPDITIRLINLPTAVKLKSVPAIYITWA